MTQEDQVFIANVMVTDPTQETMALNVTNQLTSVMAERRTIVKIRKYKGLHEGHHFIPMAMKVHVAPPSSL
jgi:exosome complex RNA-binding protein Rrp42 (RNase PH superfamily)